MNIAVADEGGNIVAHVRMDDAWIGSIDISMKKAYAPRAFDIETRELAKHSQSGGEFFGIHVSNNGKIMTFGPMMGAVMRCVADNVEDVIIPDCGHWITEVS